MAESSGTTTTQAQATPWFMVLAVLAIVAGVLIYGNNLFQEQRQAREEARLERATERLLSQAQYCERMDDGSVQVRRVEITHNTAERLSFKVINPLTVTEMTYLYGEGSGTWIKSYDGSNGNFTIVDHNGSGRRFLANYESLSHSNQFAIGEDRNDCLYILRRGL